MKSPLLCGALLLLSASFTYAQADDQPSLLAEVRNLRIELLELRIEAQAAKIPPLEQLLARVESERTKLAEEERTMPQRLASLDARAQGQTLAADQRAELENVRAAILAVQAERSSTERSTLQTRETQIVASLRLEQQRLQSLQSKLNQLTAPR